MFCRAQFQGAELVSRSFDAVITNQAVHELRHKRYARQLHAEVNAVLKPGGTYLVSDHFVGEGGLPNDQLYMTVPEQREALLNAGFLEVRKVAAAGTLVMHRATNTRLQPQAAPLIGRRP
jgi:predicted methyltransferase